MCEGKRAEDDVGPAAAAECLAIRTGAPICWASCFSVCSVNTLPAAKLIDRGACRALPVSLCVLKRINSLVLITLGAC